MGQFRAMVDSLQPHTDVEATLKLYNIDWCTIDQAEKPSTLLKSSSLTRFVVESMIIQQDSTNVHTGKLHKVIKCGVLQRPGRIITTNFKSCVAILTECDYLHIYDYNQSKLKKGITEAMAEFMDDFRRLASPSYSLYLPQCYIATIDPVECLFEITVKKSGALFSQDLKYLFKSNSEEEMVDWYVIIKERCTENEQLLAIRQQSPKIDSVNVNEGFQDFDSAPSPIKNKEQEFQEFTSAPVQHSPSTPVQSEIRLSRISASSKGKVEFQDFATATVTADKELQDFQEFESAPAVLFDTDTEGREETEMISVDRVIVSASESMQDIPQLENPW
jgi:hypothetical protein